MSLVAVTVTSELENLRHISIKSAMCDASTTWSDLLSHHQYEVDPGLYHIVDKHEKSKSSLLEKKIQEILDSYGSKRRSLIVLIETYSASALPPAAQAVSGPGQCSSSSALDQPPQNSPHIPGYLLNLDQLSEELVRIIVKSNLPEFLNLRVQQAPINPELTWGAFFQFYPAVPFDRRIHAIRSSRNTAFAEDLIQETSQRFNRRTITVHIVRADEEMKRRSQVRMERGKTTGRGRGRPRGSGIRPSQIHTVEVPIPMASTSRGQSNPVLPRRRSNGTGQNPLPMYTEDQLMTNGLSNLPGPPEVDRLRYAESLASDASQEDELIGGDNPNFSSTKIRVLKEFGKVPNVDFHKMLAEMKTLANENQKYRWSRKSPLYSGMMFQAFDV